MHFDPSSLNLKGPECGAVPSILHSSSGHIVGFRNAQDHFAAATTSYCGLSDQLYDSLEVSHTQVLSMSVADADHEYTNNV